MGLASESYNSRIIVLWRQDSVINDSHCNDEMNFFCTTYLIIGVVFVAIGLIFALSGIISLCRDEDTLDTNLKNDHLNHETKRDLDYINGKWVDDSNLGYKHLNYENKSLNSLSLIL